MDHSKGGGVEGEDGPLYLKTQENWDSRDDVSLLLGVGTEGSEWMGIPSQN